MSTPISAATNGAVLKNFEAGAGKEWDGFKAEHDQKWDEYVKQNESDAADYYSNVNAFGKAMRAKGLDAETLKAGAFESGFSYGMKGIPASHIMATISGMGRELLLPENKEMLDKAVDWVKNLTNAPAPPTKDEFEKEVKSDLEELRNDLKAQGVPDEQAERYVQHESAQADYGKVQAQAKQRQAEVEGLKAEVSAADKALDAAGIPEDHKLGSLALLGYMSGVAAHKVAEQQQAVINMIRQLSGGNPHEACKTGACGGNCGGGCGPECAGACKNAA